MLGAMESAQLLGGDVWPLPGAAEEGPAPGQMLTSRRGGGIATVVGEKEEDVKHLRGGCSSQNHPLLQP